MMILRTSFLMLLSFFSHHAFALNLFGYAEKILVNNTLLLKAKLDTGAKSASLYAIHIKEYKKNGKPWVSFVVPSKSGRTAFNSPLVGRVKIKVRHGEQSTGQFKSSITRPLVRLSITLGAQEQKIEVNLANRANFIYPMLLGRDAITQFNGAIDPEKHFTIQPVRKK